MKIVIQNLQSQTKWWQVVLDKETGEYIFRVFKFGHWCKENENPNEVQATWEETGVEIFNTLEEATNEMLYHIKNHFAEPHGHGM